MEKQILNADQPGKKGQFANLLLQWNKRQNTREMPWKGEKDPYKIWLSEIILQQTRVEQGLAYYHRFVEAFPTILDLAKAPETKVFKLWEGLGYYTRCRNLISTAQYVAGELQGKFPSTYEEIKALKGIGPYTAAAISSFAFNLPYAVVDGNVFRVLSRVFGINKPIDSTEGKKYFTELANEILDKKNPGVYNQAIMDFGATICKPSPLCYECVFNKVCFAFLHNKVNQLPVKEKKLNIKKRWFYYLVIEHDDKIAIQQRTSKDIWQQLYEFPMVETNDEQISKTVLKLAEKLNHLEKHNYKVMFISPLFKQQLTHQLISGQFIRVKLKARLNLNKDLRWVTKKQLDKFAFPNFINQYLKASS
jgi:A/G-specific adenine glycosylase